MKNNENCAVTSGAEEMTFENLKNSQLQLISRLHCSESESVDITTKLRNNQNYAVMGGADDITLEKLKKVYTDSDIADDSDSSESINLSNKMSKVKFQDTTEHILEKPANISRFGIYSKKPSSFTLSKRVSEKDKKAGTSFLSTRSSSGDILEFLVDSTNFDINLSKSFKPTRKAYDPSSDPYTQRFYELVCIRDNVRPLPVILNSLQNHKIELQQYSIYTQMFQIFMETLKHNQRVEVLDLIESQIDSKKALLIADMLDKNITIFSLNLSRNHIGREGISAIAEVLDASYSVTSLNLSENSLTNQDVAPLIKSLQSNFFLTILDLSYNKITFEHGQDLINFLTNNETLISLDLRWCFICDKGGLALAKGLKKNVSLKILDISWNGLGERGIRSIARALSFNSCLKVINLANNNLLPKTTAYLSRSLKRNKTLEILILDCNCIGDDSMKDFVKMCLKHISLVLLSLQGIQLDKKTTEYIEGLQYVITEEDEVANIVIHNDFVDMHALSEMLVKGFLKLLLEFIKANGPSLEASFKSVDKSKSGYLCLERTMQCLEKTGFYIPLKSMKELIKKLAKENIQKIPYSIFFDDTIHKILLAHKRRLKRFAQIFSAESLQDVKILKESCSDDLLVSQKFLTLQI